MKNSKLGSVNIATLKAKLASYLRFVQTGKEVIILDHKMPVAKIIPYETSVTVLNTTPPAQSFSEVAHLKIPPLEKKPKWDSLTLLLEERGSR